MSRRARKWANARPWKNGENSGGVDVDTVLASARHARRSVQIERQQFDLQVLDERFARRPSKGRR
ncbi:hypothetical protein ACWA7J_21695 [Leptothrix sp. BB-4]